MKFIFIAEASRICKVNSITFNNWVKDGIIPVEGIVPPDRRLFRRDVVEKFAKTLPKKRKLGTNILDQRIKATA